MTETRAPFNGKKKELLLIQLPMSAENVMTVRKHIMSQCVTNDAIVNGIRAIGTPVTGSELDESIHTLVSAGIRKSLKDNWTTGVFALHAKADLLAQEVIAENPEAFAKLAERDADIARLQAALSGLLQEWEKLTRYGSPLAKQANPRVATAKEVLKGGGA